ncbi:globin domain-containing protein [Deinococcus sonorensis]|uniref:Globin domain-containing protein n=2 Tax=Deinococcus sonorensis TaxID=309891 RepID=A0AAU7U6I9_9DEIO
MTPPLSLTDAQEGLVRTSLARLLRDPDEAARDFYDRLFAADPDARALFRGDLHAQGQKFIATLDVFAGDLSRFGTLRAAARRLGARHAGYGVRPGQYATVGDALLATLAARLGPDFTPEVREAWTLAYRLLAAEMRAGEPGGEP